MKKSRQNDNGRALEFILVDYFEKNNNKVVLSNNAKEYQERDLIKYENLPLDLKKEFSTAALKFYNWFLSISTNNNRIEIDRFADNTGKVYDISINNINFSIKHNHYALKHPRPYSLAQQCGFAKESEEDITHRDKLLEISDDYRDNLNGIIKYNENKELLYNLFKEVNKACKNSLEEWIKVQPKIAFNFFNFVIGSNFYKIIVKTNKPNVELEIQDFLNVPQPENFLCFFDYNRKNYLSLEFNHGWVIDLRIHSASSSIKLKYKNQLDLKFDAKRKKGEIKSINI
tara:strand:- start:745 stop:1602 length:858 start_codon:yes stop_codon:yes gene_type:complete